VARPAFLRPAHALTDPTGDGEIRPGPSNDFPAFVPDGVLPLLLLEDRVTWILARTQEAPVLDAAVELADDASVLPGEVGPPDE